MGCMKIMKSLVFNDRVYVKQFLLSGWIFLVMTVYWLVPLGPGLAPGYDKISNKYYWVVRARSAALRLLYRESVF